MKKVIPDISLRASTYTHTQGHPHIPKEEEEKKKQNQKQNILKGNSFEAHLTMVRGTMPTKVVWLMKISETKSSLMESSTGYSTCQVICWAPARLLLFSTPKSTCRIS